jgi:hypothetical protein
MGLGQSPTVHELMRLVHQFCPKIVFIYETRQQRERVGSLRFRIGLNKLFVVDGQGKGGGVGLFWDDSISINILSYGLHYIDTLIWDVEHHAHWRSTFVYSESRTQVRADMWKLLEHLKPISSTPWLLISDFNEALWSFEHLSARKWSEQQMAAFQDTLAHCDVHDLGFIGVPWTFDNKQRGDRNVRVRLDRAVASTS